MNLENVFSYCSMIAMIGWIILIISLFVKFPRKIVSFGVIPILLSVAYAYFIATSFGSAEGNFGSLEGVMSLFTNKTLALAGWIHYLAFDLWIGIWEANDAKKHGIHPLLLIPCFFFTFMFGPVGLLLYLIIKYFKTKNFSLFESI